MSTSPLPPLNALTSPEPLTSLLSLLFEPSPALRNLLVPSVLLRLSDNPTPPSYSYVIDICEEAASGWTWEQKADFLGGHPMIGEVKGLSALSGKEQGGAAATPKVVLDRLAHLNAMYNKIYPKLRYITFVNGRPRSAIIPELESCIGLSLSPNPLPDDFPTDQPSLDSEGVQNLCVEFESQAWKKECERGFTAVWDIGRARLEGLGGK